MPGPELEAADECAARKPAFAGDEHDSDDVAAFLTDRNEWADRCESCCNKLRAWAGTLDAPAE